MMLSFSRSWECWGHKREWFLQTTDKMPPEKLSDEILMTRVAQGDRAALETLYDRHAPAVLGVCYKIIGDRALAEDVLQETFWRAWQSAGTYQAQRGSFAGWLFRIARNLAIDTYRRRRVRPQVITETADANPILDEMSDPNVDIPEQVQSNLQAQQVRNALATLPPEQRKVIEMAYFYGMTRQEIAEATGEAHGTIHTRARLALQKLREALKRIEFKE
jgi:RNA polymerase sigma-70 factor, ECF subfamily